MNSSYSPLFSIVIPNYNSAKYIRNSVSDVLSQREGDWELILVDDCSSDDTINILYEYENLDKRIKVIEKSENSGPGPARNVGIDNAKGKYILFLDGDDRYEHNLLEVVKKEIQQSNPQLIVYSLVEEYDTGATYVHKRPKGYYNTPEAIHRQAAYLEKETMLGYPWNKVYLLELIKNNNIRFPDITHIEDILFNLDVMNYVNSLSILDNVLYHYKNGGSLGVTAKYLPDYFSLQKKRVIAFLDQQDSWRTCDDTVHEIAAGMYFRSLISYMEREYAAGYTRDSIIAFVLDELNSPLFDRLRDYTGFGKASKILYKPLALGKVNTVYNRIRLISFIKKRFPGLYARLKQNR